jgi:hypothetical protein
VDVFVGITKVAAGVSPQSNNDWVGLDGVSPNPTYVGTLASIGIATASYVTDLYGAQHSASHNFELFVSNQNHGEAGAHSWVTLIPSGTTFTVQDSNGTHLTPAPAIGSYSLHSYSNAAGNGQSCVADTANNVWWAWDDGIVTRISVIHGDETVNWTPLPSLGTRLGWSSFRGLAVGPSGSVGIIDVPPDAVNSPVSGNICPAGCSAWNGWVSIGNLHGESAYFNNPLQGLAQYNGHYWFGVASVDNQTGAPGQTDNNTTAAAMALESY